VTVLPRAVTLNAHDELAFMCSAVLAILEVRDRGQEINQLNLVDVTVDCDKRTVTVQTCLALEELPIVEMSAARFIEIATPLAEPRSQDQRDKWRRQMTARPMRSAP